MLQSWGYCTGYFGKNNEVPDAEVNVSGPFDRWPTRSGFDKFYGYIAGEQSNFFPSLIDGTTFIGTPHEEGYHFNHDMTSKAIGWMQATRSLTPDRPFLMYYVAECEPSAAHAAGRLVEERSLQGRVRRRLGQVPGDDAEAADRTGHRAARDQAGANPESVQKWDSLDADAKKVFARQMEVYATLTENADYEVGRLVDAHRGARRARQHAVLLHLRRQRRVDRRRSERLLRRMVAAERGAGGHSVSAQPPRRVRRPQLVSELRGRVGDGRVDAVLAGHHLRARRRQHGRHGRALAERHQGQGREAAASTTT